MEDTKKKKKESDSLYTRIAKSGALGAKAKITAEEGSKSHPLYDKKKKR
jgi:hypothetical protein